MTIMHFSHDNIIYENRNNDSNDNDNHYDKFMARNARNSQHNAISKLS